LVWWFYVGWFLQEGTYDSTGGCGGDGWVGGSFSLEVTWMVEIVADWYGGSPSVGFSRREPKMVLATVVVIVRWVAFIRLKFT
jgi:hypothetical protein